MAFTDEDKAWIAVLMQGLEERFNEKFTGLEERFNERFTGLETRFDEKLQSLEERFDEKLRNVETTLLTEFHKWASPLEMRQRSHSGVLRSLDLEVEALADRVNKLEGKAS